MRIEGSGLKITPSKSEKPKKEESKQQPVLEAKTEVRAQRAAEVKAEVSEERARQIAEQLTQSFNRSLNFIVRDPTSSQPNNIIIEIRNSEGDVISTIPSAEALQLAESIAADRAEDLKGRLLDDSVS